MRPSVLIRTRAVSDVEVAGSGLKTSVSLQRATCRRGHVEAVFQKYLHRRKEEKIMTATNMCSDFGGFRWGPPFVINCI